MDTQEYEQQALFVAIRHHHSGCAEAILAVAIHLTKLRTIGKK